MTNKLISAAEVEKIVRTEKDIAWTEGCSVCGSTFRKVERAIQALPDARPSSGEEVEGRVGGTIDDKRVERALASLREPDRSLARVANTVRWSLAEVIQDLFEDNLRFRRRQSDTEFLERAAFQLLKENDLMPSSAELLAADQRARAALKTE